MTTYISLSLHALFVDEQNRINSHLRCKQPRAKSIPRNKWKNFLFFFPPLPSDFTKNPSLFGCNQLQYQWVKCAKVIAALKVAYNTTVMLSVETKAIFQNL